MWRTVLVYGLLGGALVAVLQLLQYRLLVVGHALELYGGLVALLFSALGLWLGRRLAGARETVVVREVPVPVAVPVAVPATLPVAAPVPPPAPPTAAPAPAPTDAADVADPGRLARLGITPREHETLQLIAAGLSNREIAERLGVSENTVKTHTSRLLDKLNARRRTHAVRIAKEAGLIA